MTVKSINQFFLPVGINCLELSVGGVLGPAHITRSQEAKYDAINQHKTSLASWENFRRMYKLVLDKRNIREHHQSYLYRRRGLRVYVSE